MQSATDNDNRFTRGSAKELMIKGRFEGVCNGSVPSWSSMHFTDDVALDSSVHILGLCNPNGFSVRLFLTEGDQQEEITVLPNGCTNRIRKQSVRIFVTPLDPNLTLAAECGISATQTPPDFSMDVYLTCARED